MATPITRLAVTGSSGFIGTRLCGRAAALGIDVLPVSIRPESPSYGALERHSPHDPPQALVHLAARVHVMNESMADPLTAYIQANLDGTLALARTAAQIGVRRFVFVSSVKVNGESTLPGQPFGPETCEAPDDPYGRSKWEAEQALRELSASTGMEVVIVRPPLVYGPGVRANFQSLVRAVRRGLPLPLALATRNRRSLVGVDNLIDLLLTCASHPAAAGQTFMASDGEDISTAELLHRIGLAMGRPARLWPMPLPLLHLGAKLVGRGGMAQRLLDNLQVDIRHTRSTLNWTPPLSVDEGLRRAVQPELHDPQTPV